MRILVAVYVVAAVLVYQVSGSCYFGHSDQLDRCVTNDGSMLLVGEELTLADQCMKCSCHARVGETALLHCCGYGIHAGAIIPPRGCKVTAGDDGCSVEIVNIADGSPCHP